MTGTIRTLDPDMQKDIHNRVRTTAVSIAQASGAEAEVSIGLGAPVTWNDPPLTERLVPSLERLVGGEKVRLSPPHTGAEDFAFYAEKIPSFYFWLGVVPPGTPADQIAPNHSPLFRVDEDALVYGVRAMAAMTVDYMEGR
jgi:amidohydrolase